MRNLNVFETQETYKYFSVYNFETKFGNSLLALSRLVNAVRSIQSNSEKPRQQWRGF